MPADVVKPGRLWLLGCIASLGGFLFGYDTSSMSAALTQVKQPRSSSTCPGLATDTLEPIYQEFVVSFMVLGAFLSATCAGSLSDSYGRRPLLLVGCFFFVVGAVLTALATSLSFMLVARLVQGFGVGIASHTVPLYISECTRPEVRGSFCFLNDMMIVVGQVSAAIVSSIFFQAQIADGWRIILGLAAIPSAAMLLGVAFLPESPRWLMSKGRLEEARKVLEYLRDADSDIIDQEFDSIADNVRSEFGIDPSSSLHSSRGSFWGGFWKDLHTRRALMLGCGLMALQQWSGINTIMYYGVTIMQSADPADDLTDCFGPKVQKAVLIGVLLAVSQLVGVAASWFMVDRVGRRPLILCSCTGVIISLVATGFAFTTAEVHQTLVVLFIISYLLSFGLGMSPVPWTVNSEIYPLRWRGVCVSLSTSTHWIMNFIISQTFLSLSTALSSSSGNPANHPNGVFWLYGGVSAIGCVTLWFYMPETKGVHLERVSDLFTTPEERALKEC